ADRGEGLVEAALDGVGQLGPQLLELLQARLEVGPLVDQLRQPLLLALVLLLGQRVALAERLAAALQPLDLAGELVAVVPFGRFGAGLLQPSARLVRLGLEPRALDVDRRAALARLGRLAPGLGFRPAESPQLRRQLPGARRARIDPSLQRRLEPLRRLRRARERRREPLGQDS